MFDLLKKHISNFVEGAKEFIGEKKKEVSQEVAAKVATIGKGVKEIATGELEIEEKDLEPHLRELEISLLSSNVAQEAVQQVISDLKKDLVGRKLKKAELNSVVKASLRSSFERLLMKERPLIKDFIKGKPSVILFFGPNGTGKTTTIAKVALLLKEQGYNPVIAAADTFRAAAIEQLEKHGANIDVKVIKSKYGADPASVAYTAKQYAIAHSCDVVLVDTAGRQDLNRNLMKELAKIARVSSPDAKFYIGESITGNAIVEQVNAFNKEIKIDGVILTKVDLDRKGGSVISVEKATGVPILYVTNGQGYKDIEPFDGKKYIDLLLP
ncbi:MAG: signal recognition particle-docking protein FtsY [Candidatus Anstonellales archaeon]